MRRLSVGLALVLASTAVSAEEPVDAVSGGVAPLVESDEAPIVIEEVEPTSDDSIVIVDEEPPLIVLDEGERSATSLSTFLGRTYLRSELSSRLLVDTSFNRTGEDVLEWWSMGRLALDHKPFETLRAVAEAWVRAGVAGERAGRDETFLVYNSGEPKWVGDVQLREAYVEWAPRPLVLRVGQRIFVWGKNEIFPAADVLNPIDLRYDIVSVLDNPRDSKVPVFALDAAYDFGPAALELVLLPFFTANKAFVIGRDFALAPPGSPLAEQIRGLGAVDPSIEDELQQSVSGTRLPEESPRNVSLALRGTTKLGGWDLALTGYYGWDRTPKVHLDSDLALLLQNGERLTENPQLAATEPELRDATLAVQQKLAIGEALVRATYERYWLFAAEAQGVVGDVVLRADVGFSPRQIYYTQDFEVVTAPSARAAIGAEYTYGETLYAQLTGYGTAAIAPPSDAVLVGVENTEQKAEDRPLAALYGLAATVRWREPEWRLSAELTGLYNIAPGDYVALAQVGYVFVEPHEVRIGGALLGGKGGSTGDTYDKSDFVFLAYRSTL